MRISRTLLCIGLLISSAAGMAWSKEADSDAGNEGPTIRNFSLPEYNEKMELVSRIEGDAAKAVQDDTFEITNLRFEMYRSGKVNARCTTIGGLSPLGSTLSPLAIQHDWQAGC